MPEKRKDAKPLQQKPIISKATQPSQKTAPNLVQPNGKETPQTQAGNSKQNNSFLKGCLGCFGVSVVLVIIVILGAALLSMINDGLQTDDAQQPPLSTARTGTEQPNGSFEQDVRSDIIDVVGNKNNLGGERILNLQANDHLGTKSEGDKIVVATLLADDAGSSTKSRMQFQAMDMFKKLFARSEIEEVTIIWQFPLVDTYGNVNNKPVMKITIDKATVGKINWDHFNRNNFSKVANAYYEHPVIQKDK